MGRFDFKKVDDFEKHIELSIPNFLTLDNIFKHVTHEFAQPESTVVDLGCSTGRFLSGLTQIEGCQYVGVDTVDMETRRDNFLFIEGDVEKWLEEQLQNTAVASVIVSMFFLQFLGAKKRARVLNLIRHHIELGAKLLISEKVFLEDSRLQSLIHRLHIQEKRKGFTEKEILDKDLQLSVSMFCKQESELEAELKQLGAVTKVWQSYNFMGYVVQ
jgi:tRNA (cmo5U34)-methyltransferase|tara:strand:+ start:1454 stop:2098 length:645 start_codon:yes stop_codon:yes gene_type:complete